MDYDAWMMSRRTGIGGSDAAAVLGISRWRTPLDVYREKRGEITPQNDSDAMLWGRLLEPVIRQHYAEHTGREVRVPTDIVRHPRYSYMIGTLDGITSDGRILEIKTARTGRGWGEPGSSEIPSEYLVQVQHYMCITGIAVADVAVLIGSCDYRLYEVPADRELQQLIVDVESDFWARIMREDPPEPTSYAELVARFGSIAARGSIEASDDVLAAVERLRSIKEEMERLEEEEKEARAVVMKAMGEHDTLIHRGEIIATWKNTKPTMRLDQRALKLQHPDIYEQFLRAGEVTRRFLLK